MRKTSGSSLALCLTAAVALLLAIAPAMYTAAQAQDSTRITPVTAAQLDKLLAPIALYSDPLLAQVLLAATFPDQITDAAQYVREHGTGGIDDQAWDVSVKSVAHYPTILNMMDAKPEWTTELGQAYASQSTEVMDAVQRLRGRANAQGNLVTTAQQQVVVEPNYIAIWPANPRVIYVPVYDPFEIYVRHVVFFGRYPGAFAFGIGFPIGPWLIYDWDWPGRRVYYTGWVGGGWIGRSRPYINVTNVYVNERFRSFGPYERVHYTNPGRYIDRHRDGRPENWARGHDTFNRNPEWRGNRDEGHATPMRERRPASEPRNPSHGFEQGTRAARPESRGERYMPAPQAHSAPAPAPQPHSAPAPQPSGAHQGGGHPSGGSSHQGSQSSGKESRGGGGHRRN